MRIIATATLALALAGGVAAPADAYRISGPDRKVSTLRVTYAERDGKALNWMLNSGAAFRTPRLAACKREARPRLCRVAYRKAGKLG